MVRYRKLKNMELTKTTEVYLTFQEIEEYIRSKNAIESNYKLLRVIKGEQGLKFLFINKSANAPKADANLPLPDGTDEEPTVCSPEQKQILELPLEHLDLSTRVFNLLNPYGFKLIKDLVQVKPSQLRKIHGFGGSAMANLEDALKYKDEGLKLNMKIPQD